MRATCVAPPLGRLDRGFQGLGPGGDEVGTEPLDGAARLGQPGLHLLPPVQAAVERPGEDEPVAELAARRNAGGDQPPIQIGTATRSRHGARPGRCGRTDLRGRTSVPVQAGAARRSVRPSVATRRRSPGPSASYSTGFQPTPTPRRKPATGQQDEVGRLPGDQDRLALRQDQDPGGERQALVAPAR